MTDMLNIPILSLEISLRLLAGGSLPAHKGGLVHGTLGKALREIDSNTFAQLFGEGGEDFPRPFTLLPPLSSCRTFLPGSVLTFGLTLFGPATERVGTLLSAVEAMADNGWGESRTPMAVAGIASLLPDGCGRRRAGGIRETSLPAILDAASCAQDSTVDLLCLTPLRLKHEGGILQHAPELRVVLQRTLGRINQLAAGTPVSPELRNTLLAAADTAFVSWSDLTWTDWERYSARQKSAMQFGGWTGTLQWCGVHPSLQPWVALMQWLSIGSKTTFGLGQVRLLRPEK